VGTEPEYTKSRCVGAILAGGQSLRMGQPKEGVPLPDGRPMIEHVMDALQPCCATIAIIGQCRGYSVEEQPSLIHLPDRVPGLGPLSGLEALLASGLGDQYLVLTCDQPLLRPELLQRLLNHESGGAPVFFKTAEGREYDPFPGLYPTKLLESVRQALREGCYAMRPLIRRHPVQWVTIPADEESYLLNANTPDALATVESLLRQREAIA
jgi:molybdopterin-guanine dinucleotide biosynthesis protein A